MLDHASEKKLVAKKEKIARKEKGLRLSLFSKTTGLKVHKREKFFSSDFEFFTILYLVKLKY